MGELLGIPEWLAVTGFVILSLLAYLTFGYFGLRRAHHRLLRMRPSPTRDEFLAMMSKDMELATAEFLWEKASFYVQLPLAPHPDDDPIKDLCIDGDDISMDWPRDWAELRGFHQSNLPDWPSGWQLTLRNFGRWLDMAPG